MVAVGPVVFLTPSNLNWRYRLRWSRAGLGPASGRQMSAVWFQMGHSVFWTSFGSKHDLFLKRSIKTRKLRACTCWLLTHCFLMYSCACLTYLRVGGDIIWWEFMWVDCTNFKISLASERLSAGEQSHSYETHFAVSNDVWNYTFLLRSFHWHHEAAYTAARSNGALEINALKERQKLFVWSDEC
jgi:hypothetical protein